MSALPKDGFAALSAGLLARKGAARPAMRPGGTGNDDLGWNDMTGGAAATPKRTPITFASATDARGQQAALEQAFAPEPETAGGPRRAFTLRLDADRHARLRAACDASGASAQYLLTTALDRLLAGRHEGPSS